MCNQHFDELWRDFPQTLLEFEDRFSTEEACRDYLAECRWNGQPACAKCDCTELWLIRNDTLYECASCGHLTSLTSGTLFHGTRKPIRLWFRAIWEVCIHRHGISAKNLQPILGLGSYETAWVWLHKIRRAFLSPNRDKLADFAQVDEAFIGGKGAEKEIVVIAAEEQGRVRLIHAPSNKQEIIKHIVDAEIAPQTGVKTDGHASYNEHSLDGRTHSAKVQTNQERKENDYLQLCHWTASNIKRWLLGTHHGAVRPKHLQSYLDEYSFRYNRRNTDGIGRLAARCLENMVTHKPMTMRQLIDNTKKCRYFQTTELLS